jgi:hypothetical protein
MKGRAWFSVGIVLGGAGILLLLQANSLSPVVLEGEMWVPRGGTERHVLTLHDPLQAERVQATWGAGAAMRAFHAAQPLDAIPLPAPARRILPADLRYDVVELPFDVVFLASTTLAEAQTRDVLRIHGGHEDTAVVVMKGTTVEVGPCEAIVADVRPWGGLLRDPAGRAMADVALRLPGKPWVENIFVTRDSWTRAGESAAVRLEWFGSEEEASEAAGQAPTHLDAMRWGVVEGPVVHWMSSFTPGTALELADGRVVTLERLARLDSAGGPLLQLQVEDGEQRERVQVAANAGDATALIQFEDWSSIETAVTIYGWSNDRCLVALYRNGTRSELAPLPVGRTFTSSAIPLDLRVDQLEQHALPYPRHRGEATVFEVHLQSEEGLLRIRHGESLRWCGVTLSYEREAAAARHAIDVRIARGGRARHARITSEEALFVGPWVLRVAPSGGAVDEGVTLVASVRWSRGIHLAGVLLVLIGAVSAGWGFIRLFQ